MNWTRKVRSSWLRRGVSASLLCLFFAFQAAAFVPLLKTAQDPTSCCRRKNGCCCKNKKKAAAAVDPSGLAWKDRDCARKCRLGHTLPARALPPASPAEHGTILAAGLALLLAAAPETATSSYLAFLYQRPPPSR
jgi:hypothetical protein